MEQPNILKHNLVPEHTKLSEEEKKKVLEYYNISIKQLPKILLNDPAIQHFQPQIGDVIKIRRKSPTAKETLFYRVVVRG